MGKNEAMREITAVSSDLDETTAKLIAELKRIGHVTKSDSGSQEQNFKCPVKIRGTSQDSGMSDSRDRIGLEIERLIGRLSNYDPSSLGYTRSHAKRSNIDVPLETIKDMQKLLDSGISLHIPGNGHSPEVDLPDLPQQMRTLLPQLTDHFRQLSRRADPKRARALEEQEQLAAGAEALLQKLASVFHEKYSSQYSVAYGMPVRSVLKVPRIINHKKYPMVNYELDMMIHGISRAFTALKEPSGTVKFSIVAAKNLDTYLQPNMELVVDGGKGSFSVPAYALKEQLPDILNFLREIDRYVEKHKEIQK